MFKIIKGMFKIIKKLFKTTPPAPAGVGGEGARMKFCSSFFYRPLEFGLPKLGITNPVTYKMF